MKPNKLTKAELKKIARFHIASICFWDQQAETIQGLSEEECSLVAGYVEQHAVKMGYAETKNLGASIDEVAAKVAGLPFDQFQVSSDRTYAGAVIGNGIKTIPPPPPFPQSRVIVEGKNPPLPPPIANRNR